MLSSINPPRIHLIAWMWTAVENTFLPPSNDSFDDHISSFAHGLGTLRR